MAAAGARWRRSRHKNEGWLLQCLALEQDVAPAHCLPACHLMPVSNADAIALPPGTVAFPQVAGALRAQRLAGPARGRRLGFWHR